MAHQDSNKSNKEFSKQEDVKFFLEIMKEAMDENENTKEAYSDGYKILCHRYGVDDHEPLTFHQIKDKFGVNKRKVYYMNKKDL